MSIAPSCRVHPTAIIDPEAELADNVTVGPYVVIEGKVRVGPDCDIRARSTLIGELTLGRGNMVCTGAVLGEAGQHLRYIRDPGRVEIGDHNIFRENVTVHRSTPLSPATRIGSHNFFMAGSHVAHDCVLGDRIILANGALLGGHSVLEDGVIISGNAAVHQFIRVGRLAFLSGCASTTKDMPPFVIQEGRNTVVGVNVIGMRRAGLGPEQINGVRKAYHFLFRQGRTLPDAVRCMEGELCHLEAVREMVAFLKKCPKGINTARDRRREHRDAA